MNEPTVTPFYALPDTLRFAFLDALTALSDGQSAWHYTNDGILIAVPNGRYGELRQLARRYSLAEGPLHYFPLGSDKPADILRHECPKYPGSRGFWLYARFTVKG